MQPPPPPDSPGAWGSPSAGGASHGLRGGGPNEPGSRLRGRPGERRAGGAGSTRPRAPRRFPAGAAE